MASSIYNYIFLTGNAISYCFKGNKLIKSEIFVFPANAVSGNLKIDKNPITTYKSEIEAFAKKTNLKNSTLITSRFTMGLLPNMKKKLTWENSGNGWKTILKPRKIVISFYVLH